MPPLFGFEPEANRVGNGGTDEYNLSQFEPSRTITIGLNLNALKFCYL